VKRRKSISPGRRPSILQGQKPTKARHLHTFSRKILKVLPQILATLTVILSITAVSRYIHLQSMSHRLVANWEIQAHLAAGESLEGEEQTTSSLEEFVSQQLTNTKQVDFQTLAQQIQAKFTFDQVSIVQTGGSSLAIEYRPRHPIMRVKADEIRLVSAAGQIYGVARHPTDDGLPLIEGLNFGSNDHLKWSDAKTLVLDAKTETALKEILTLHNDAKAAGFNFDLYSYAPFRGITTHEVQKNIEIVVGRPPYAQRLESLKKILSNLEQRGSQAQRIELDYQGKAFIKEKRS